MHKVGKLRTLENLVRTYRSAAAGLRGSISAFSKEAMLSGGFVSRDGGLVWDGHGTSITISNSGPRYDWNVKVYKLTKLDSGRSKFGLTENEAYAHAGDIQLQILEEVAQAERAAAAEAQNQ